MRAYCLGASSMQLVLFIDVWYAVRQTTTWSTPPPRLHRHHWRLASSSWGWAASASAQSSYSSAAAVQTTTLHTSGTAAAAASGSTWFQFTAGRHARSDVLARAAAAAAEAKWSSMSDLYLLQYQHQRPQPSNYTGNIYISSAQSVSDSGTAAGWVEDTSSSLNTSLYVIHTHRPGPLHSHVSACFTLSDAPLVEFFALVPWYTPIYLMFVPPSYAPNTYQVLLKMSNGEN